MFEQTFVQTGKTNKGWTVMVSLIVQCLLLVVAVILPMVYFDVLPAAQLSSFLVAPPPPPPPPPPPAAAPIVKIVKVIPRQFDAGRLVAPKAVPKNIAMITEEELPPSTGGGVIGGVPGGVAGGSLSGILGGIVGSAASAAPPPPPPPKAAVPQRIRVGGNVQAANLINQVRPIYPPLAKQARISGVVELSAVIGKDGRVQDLKVIKGHPLLVQAALDAVKNWVYRPTLLNGEPVEVSTTIDVNFTLSQ
ncbi:MAG: energy transducer TonB [Bryobacteraceae bacterium]|jgi:protein TonB